MLCWKSGPCYCTCRVDVGESAKVVGSDAQMVGHIARRKAQYESVARRKSARMIDVRLGNAKTMDYDVGNCRTIADDVQEV